MTPIIGLGAGGHAKVLIEILRLRGEYEVVGLLDPDENKWHTQIHGVPVLGNDELLVSLLSQGICHAFIGLGGVGNNRPRRELYERAIQLGFFMPSILHPQAIISPSAKLGLGTNILAGAVLNAAACLGDNVIINSGVIVEHDCVIDNHVHIATGARLGGTVHVMEEAHVGAGATIKQHITIGARSIVGAGAVVVKDVPAAQTVVGVPAKPLKR